MSVHVTCDVSQTIPRDAKIKLAVRIENPKIQPLYPNAREGQRRITYAVNLALAPMCLVFTGPETPPEHMAIAVVVNRAILSATHPMGPHKFQRIVGGRTASRNNERRRGRVKLLLSDGQNSLGV